MARPFLVASLDAEGSILVMMMAKLVGFATVTSEFFWFGYLQLIGPQSLGSIVVVSLCVLLLIWV